MKKLLSLLSFVTISGTAVPTVIAPSPYQKEEIIKNSNINYLQTNNLEYLSRGKRNPQYNPVIGQGGGQQIYNPQTGGWGQSTYLQPQSGKLAPSILNKNSNVTTPFLLQSGKSFPINNDKFYYIGPSTGLLYFHERGSGSIMRIIQINEKIKWYINWWK